MIPTSLSLLCYGGAWILLIRRLQQRLSLSSAAISALVCLALSLNAWAIFEQIHVQTGYQFGFFKVAPLFFWSANALIFLSSLKKPMHSLLLFTLPLSLAASLASLIVPNSSATPIALGPGLLTHVLLSLLAYSLMLAAVFQALILAYQNHKLRSKHPGGWLRLLPPLQTMEALLFELLWAGEIVLTLAIVSGGLFVENLLAQHLAQKTVFSLLAWATYALLLWGRHARGWRGAAAMRWTFAGFAFLLLAYFGSKFVLELILQRA
ncbi:MAG TPA: cytochrome c biogenesis protein CcsA [Cellvibrionaceae bacterium]